MLLPTSMVAINCPGVLRNLLIILALIRFLLLSSSNLSLSDDTKAISMPEKKAEAINVIVMIISSFINFDQISFVIDIDGSFGSFKNRSCHLSIRLKSSCPINNITAFFNADEFVGEDLFFLDKID